MSERARVVGAFAGARWGRPCPTRDDLLRHQQGRIRRFLRAELPLAKFYRDLRARRLEQLPIVDKATIVADFAGFNSRGITLDAAMRVAVAAERSRDFAPTIDGLTVGLSSGTSGTRSVFLVSADERQRWAGLVLARLLSSASLRQLVTPWQRPLRLAFFLRANSNLYATVASRRIAFAFHDLLVPLEQHIEQLNATPPDILVAPPTVLHRLALAAIDGSLKIAPRQIVSVAEVIEPDDRIVIGRAFTASIQEVYQATEGFLAATCAAGRLHLNEEFLHIESEWLDDSIDGHRRFRPIITDVTRTTQLVVRYRLDDVLREAQGPCPCGRVTRSLAAVEGRADDVLWCRVAGGATLRPVFPDTIRRAMALAGTSLADYRIEQRGRAWDVQLCCDVSVVVDVQQAVRHELAALADGLSLRRPDVQFALWTTTSAIDKRRRIRCVERPVEGA